GVAQASGLPRIFPEVKQPIFINLSIFSPESIGNLGRLSSCPKHPGHCRGAMHSTHYIEANTFLRLGPAIQWVGAYPDRLASEGEPNTMFSPREIDNDRLSTDVMCAVGNLMS